MHVEWPAFVLLFGWKRIVLVGVCEGAGGAEAFSMALPNAHTAASNYEGRACERENNTNAKSITFQFQGAFSGLLHTNCRQHFNRWIGSTFGQPYVVRSVHCPVSVCMCASLKWKWIFQRPNGYVWFDSFRMIIIMIKHKLNGARTSHRYSPAYLFEADRGCRTHYDGILISVFDQKHYKWCFVCRAHQVLIHWRVRFRSMVSYLLLSVARTFRNLHGIRLVSLCVSSSKTQEFYQVKQLIIMIIIIVASECL